MAEPCQCKLRQPVPIQSVLSLPNIEFVTAILFISQPINRSRSPYTMT